VIFSQALRLKKRSSALPVANKTAFITVIGSIFVFTAFFLSIASAADCVPAAPNETIIEGDVLESCVASSSIYDISPRQVLYKFLIQIEKTEEELNMPNFLKVKEGQKIEVFTKMRPSQEVFGAKIRAKAEFIGDERGGRYWIKSIEIIH
jgi:hypothetical protein